LSANFRNRTLVGQEEDNWKRRVILNGRSAHWSNCALISKTRSGELNH